MISFEDGPAKGTSLRLRLAPRYLRVTQSTHNGSWDALDLPDDAPRSGERLFAYERIGEALYAFVDFGGKNRWMSGRYAMATYRLVPNQPSEEQMREASKWQAWFQEKAGILAP